MRDMGFSYFGHSKRSPFFFQQGKTHTHTQTTITKSGMKLRSSS